MSMQQTFNNLREKLDKLGYMQPFGFDSLALVESLFTDLVWTTEEFRKCQSELEKRVQTSKSTEDEVESLKPDNALLLSENDRLKTEMATIRLNFEAFIQNLQANVCQLEKQKYQLVLLNQECVEKNKRMAQKIEQLRRKNFDSVIHLRDGKRKLNPIIQGEMCVDAAVTKNSSNIDDYYSPLSIEKAASCLQQSESCSSDQCDLFDAITNKCKELSQQLSLADEELALSDTKILKYCDKLRMYEEEICRLSKELGTRKCRTGMMFDEPKQVEDKLVDQLNIQLDTLQKKNEELEREIMCLNIINAKKNEQSNDCMIERQNRTLMTKIDDLVAREQELLQELRTAKCKLDQRKSDCIPIISESLEKEVGYLQKHVRTLEEERNYWRHETENCNYDKDDIPSRDGNDICQIRKELLCCQEEIKDVMSQNIELRQLLNMSEKKSISSLNGKNQTPNLEEELRDTRAERDSLQNLLDKYERQLHDVHGNLRVLTQERDSITKRYNEDQKELHELRGTIMQSYQSNKPNNSQNTMVAQSLLKKLESSREDSLTDLHRMTTERDSLRERLKTVTETTLSEKARLSQKLEDSENKKQMLSRDKNDLSDKLMTLRNKVGELEENNYKYKKRNDSLMGNIEKDRMRLQEMTEDLQRFENEVQMKERKESQLSEELKDTENRFMTLQERAETQNIDLMNLRNDFLKLKEIASDVEQEKNQMQSELDAKSKQLLDIHCQLKMKEDALDEVRINLCSLEQQLKRIQEINTHRDKEMRDLVVHNKELENDLRFEICKNDQLKADNMRIEEDLMLLTRDQHRLEANLRESKKCFIENMEDKDELEQRFMNCESGEFIQQKENMELLAKYRELSLDNDKLRLMLQRTEGENEQLITETGTKEKLVRNMKEQLLQADEEIQSLQCNLRQFEDRLGNNDDNLHRQLSSRILELDRLNMENAHLIRDNEILHEGIDSLQESIRSLEAVISVSKEKEFRDQMDNEQRIVELETENKELINYRVMLQQLHWELNDLKRRNSGLESECKCLRLKLESERCRQELDNQRKWARKECGPLRYSSNKERFTDKDALYNDEELYSENESESDNQYPMTSTGFCTDDSIEQLSRVTDCGIMCNHGCYHSRECNNTAPNKRYGETCGHGCHHSDECWHRRLKKQRIRSNDRRKSTGSHGHDVADASSKGGPSHINSNNHKNHDKVSSSIVTHTHPKCPYNTHSSLKNTQTDALKSSAVQTESKKIIGLEKLPTIISESGSVDGGDSSSRTVSPSNNEKDEYTSNNDKKENTQLVEKKKDFPSNMSKDQRSDQIIHLLNVAIDSPASITKRKSQIPRPPLKDHVEQSPQLASVMTNETALSLISRVTPSTKNLHPSSTLAQLPSLSSGSGQELFPIITNKERANVNGEDPQLHRRTISSNVVLDEDQTDVSQSLTHSFYNISQEFDTNISNSPSGVKTGNSFTETSSENNVTSVPVTTEALAPVESEPE